LLTVDEGSALVVREAEGDTVLTVPQSSVNSSWVLHMSVMVHRSGKHLLKVKRKSVERQ
jgi:hypothetical protein